MNSGHHMSILLKILPHHLPAFIREEILSALFEATAQAFGCPAPAHTHLSYDECLQAYALFTSQQAEQALQEGRDITAIKASLFHNAYPLGEKLHRWFGIDEVGDVMEIGQILYQAIGVDFQGDSQGEVTVKRCYFSQFYSAAACDLISALDDGVFAGLSGGGRLAFSQRITEGENYCKANLKLGLNNDHITTEALSHRENQ